MRKYIIFILEVLLMMAVFSGCKDENITQLVDRMYNTKVDSEKINVNYNIDLIANIDENDYNLITNGNALIEASGLDKKENILLYGNGNLNYDLFGLITENRDFKVHLETKESTVSIEYFDNTDKQWHKKDYDFTDKDSPFTYYEKNHIKELYKEICTKSKLEKVTKKIGDEECYVLKKSLSRSDYNEIADSISQKYQTSYYDELETVVNENCKCELDDILNFVKVDIITYISKENGYLAGIEADFSKTDINGIFKALGMNQDENIKFDNLYKINKLSFKCEMEDIN